MFWEATIFANGVISFTTNGFFDKEGYVEPKLSSASGKAAAILIPLLVGAITIMLGVAYKNKTK